MVFILNIILFRLACSTLLARIKAIAASPRPFKSFHACRVVGFVIFLPALQIKYVVAVAMAFVKYVLLIFHVRVVASHIRTSTWSLLYIPGLYT